MLYVPPLPVAELTSILEAPPPPLPPEPAAPRIVRVAPPCFNPKRLCELRTIPKQVAIIRELPPALPSAGVLGGIPGGVPGGQIGGVIGGILYAVPSPVPPPPPPSKPVTEAAAPAPKPPEPIHVVGDVEAARLISAPQPTYPQLAKVGRVPGLVRLDATIGKDGRIENLNVVSRNPLLINAAVNAVKQWVYRPTYLNGRAVQVATEIDVHFQLTDRCAK